MLNMEWIHEPKDDRSEMSLHSGYSGEFMLVVRYTVR